MDRRVVDQLLPLHGDARLPARSRRARRIRAGHGRVRTTRLGTRARATTTGSSARSRSASTASSGSRRRCSASARSSDSSPAIGAFVVAVAYGVAQIAGQHLPGRQPDDRRARSCLMGGLQLICFGIMGQYIGRHLRRGRSAGRDSSSTAPRASIVDRRRSRSRAHRARTTRCIGPMTDDYTAADHEFRDDDVYALGKYQLDERVARAAPATAARSSTSGAAPGSSTRWPSTSDSRCRASNPTRRPSRSRSRTGRRQRCEVQQLGHRGHRRRPRRRRDRHARRARAHRRRSRDGRAAGNVAQAERRARAERSGDAVAVRLPRRAARPLPPVHAPHAARRARNRLPIDTPALLRHHAGPGHALVLADTAQALPTANVGGPGASGKPLGVVCRIEERVPGPLGTSLVCMARPTRTL